MEYRTRFHPETSLRTSSDDDSASDDETSEASVGGESEFFGEASDPEESSYSEESDDDSSLSAEDRQDNSPEDGLESQESLGRGSRSHVPNPKYYGDDFLNFQFLQDTFVSLDDDSRAQYLKYALADYRMSGKTTLVERFLTGVILTQMSARAGLVKHGKDAEKVLLKEFHQFKNMDVMEALDPDKLTPQQIKDALGMISVLQEKRDHTLEDPSLKYRGCADGRKQRGLYTKEQTASPMNGVDAFLMTLMTDAMEGRDVAISDIVGAYLNAIMDEFVAMKVIGREAELMCELNPEWRRGRAVLCETKEGSIWLCAVRSTVVRAILINPEGHGICGKPLRPMRCEQDNQRKHVYDMLVR